MEEERLGLHEQKQPEKPYVPRPWWQVWGARLLLVIFIIGIIVYYLSIARRYG